MTIKSHPAILAAAEEIFVKMVLNFSKEEIQNIFTNEETTEALLNGGYRPEFIYGFHAAEVMDILYSKYKGDITIVHKKKASGFIAMLSDKEVFDSAIFDPATPIVNAFGHLLLLLDNKFESEEDEVKTDLQASS